MPPAWSHFLNLVSGALDMTTCIGYLTTVWSASMLEWKGRIVCQPLFSLFSQHGWIGICQLPTAGKLYQGVYKLGNLHFHSWYFWLGGWNMIGSYLENSECPSRTLYHAQALGHNVCFCGLLFKLTGSTMDVLLILIQYNRRQPGVTFIQANQNFRIIESRCLQRRVPLSPTQTRMHSKKVSAYGGWLWGTKRNNVSHEKCGHRGRHLLFCEIWKDNIRWRLNLIMLYRKRTHLMSLNSSLRLYRRLRDSLALSHHMMPWCSILGLKPPKLEPFISSSFAFD